RIVELDALMLLECAAHRRAVAVRCIDERIAIATRDRSCEERMTRVFRSARALRGRQRRKLACKDPVDACACAGERPRAPPDRRPHVGCWTITLTRGQVVNVVVAGEA